MNRKLNIQYKRLAVSIILLLLFIGCKDTVTTISYPGLCVAMAQMDIKDGDMEENMKCAEKNIREAAGLNVDMVCLPEATDLGWLYQEARRDALPIPGKYSDFLSGLAKELSIWISAGCLEKDGDKTYNSAILIDRTGKVVLRHRKIKTLSSLTEHLYDRGCTDSIKVVDTEFGRVGLTICADNFDLENPEKVASQGAWLLITPHGFAAKVNDLENNAVEYMNHIKGVAAKTNLWVVGTNSCLSLITGGEWKGYLHSGASTIADPEGKAVAIGKIKETDLVIYNIPPGTLLRD
jgi:N-carbamoylputrescine amidase